MQVEDKWQGFVAENILFYTNILRLLLPRFFRMDLTANKNACILFRIAKIYSLSGLVALVKKAETGLDRVNFSFDYQLDRFPEMPMLLSGIEVGN